MSKLHFCQNGTSVTEQVMKYRKSENFDDYIPVQKYYDEYKGQWYNQVSDYIDKPTFDQEFDFKLLRAIQSFNEGESKRLADEFGWSDLGRFNRWFFKILTNWKSNVKNSSFRLKKRPPVQCPICNKFVGRIDQEHLYHYKTIRDLPNVMTWNGDIYEVCLLPKSHVTTWGEKTSAKLNTLLSDDAKSLSDSAKKIRWPWKLSDGKRGVLCPCTKRIVPEITDEHIRALSEKYNRYAPSTLWEKFIEDYPNALIQSDVYSLEHSFGDGSDGDDLSDYVARDNRIGKQKSFMDYKDICRDKVSVNFEHTFYAIDRFITDESDKMILKLIAAGYTVDDISETIDMPTKDVRKRLKAIRENQEFQSVLVDAV